MHKQSVDMVTHFLIFNITPTIHVHSKHNVFAYRGNSDKKKHVSTLFLLQKLLKIIMAPIYQKKFMLC